MSVFDMVLGIVFITSLASVLREFAKRSSGKAQTELLAEVRALREEVRQLRQQNTDCVLGLDTTVQRLDQRLGRLEASALGAPGEGQRVGRA